MYNLNDLIQDIHANEAIHIPGTLSHKQKTRIEKKVLSSIYQDTSNLIEYKKTSKRKYLVVALAAILILLLGITAIAASQKEWDILLTNFMGLHDSSTLQLESGQVSIKAEAEANGIKLYNITSIGDKNTAYIRLDTNLEIPENFDETTDYILPENYGITISRKEKGTPLAHGTTLTCFVENNKLGFLLEIADCKNLNKAYVSLMFEDLIWYHDLHLEDGSAKPKELLLDGKWNLQWKYAYQSSTLTHRMLQKMYLLENTVWITKVDVSPLSIRIEGKRAPQHFSKPWVGEVSVEEVGFKNGEVIQNPSFSAAGRSNMTFNYYINVGEFGRTINPEDLDYIIINNQKICF